MTKLLETFLKKVDVIKKSKPTYRQPGDGSDGTCDCIGLIIGAVRRCGLKWTGIHGSNYAARKASVNFRAITDPSQLEVGDMVLKGRKPGEAKYDLPSRYKKGGVYYNGDLTDYYHAGVVTSVNPLQITHMTSPTVKVDTVLGKWLFAARVKPLADAGAYSSQPSPTPTPRPEPQPEPTPTPSSKTAVVTAPSGRTVKMRQKPTTSCSMYDDVPIGATVKVVEKGSTWTKISYGRRTGWYMMTKFLKFQ